MNKFLKYWKYWLAIIVVIISVVAIVLYFTYSIFAHVISIFIIGGLIGFICGYVISSKVTTKK